MPSLFWKLFPRTNNESPGEEDPILYHLFLFFWIPRSVSRFRKLSHITCDDGGEKEAFENLGIIFVIGQLV